MLKLSITNIIILITVLISIAGFSNRQLFDRLKFNGYMIFHHKELWRFVTSAFVHVDFFHLFVNMYVLYIFGNSYNKPGYEQLIGVEGYFQLNFGNLGVLYYVLLYLMACIVSSIYSYEKHKHDIHYNAVGASGATSAILFAFIAIAPVRSLYLLFLPFPIPGFILGALYLIYSWYMARKKIDNIGHDAHFFGAVFGFLFVFLTDFSAFSKFIHSVVYYFNHIL